VVSLHVQSQTQRSYVYQLSARFTSTATRDFTSKRSNIHKYLAVTALTQLHEGSKAANGHLVDGQGRGQSERRT
jgi:hypothetical protein